MHRLVPWLNRELHYLLNENVGHIAYVISRIVELLPQYHINSPEVREALQVYFRDRTEHFLHELYCFASTPYDLTGYDRNVQYTTDNRISTMVNEVLSSSESEASVDSDIVMVSSSGPADPPPGPSRLPAPVYPQNYIPPPATNNVIAIETISQSDTDDDDEVMVVGYIKPPQDRTPEVVDLLGSDSDVIVQDNTSSTPEPQPHSSESQESRAGPLVKLMIKAHSIEEGSDSDSEDSYRPPRSPRYRHSATTSDTCRTTPSPLTPPTPPTPSSDWDHTNMATTSYASCIAYKSVTSSSSDTESNSSSSSSGNRKKRPTKRRKLKRKKEVGPNSGGERTKSKARASIQQRRQAQLEKDKASKRKSFSGKGVKSSKKKIESVSASQQVQAADQPGPSSASHTNKTNKGKKRPIQTPIRESKRLKSVVNVMYNQKNAGESSSSGAASSLSSAVVNVSAGRSDNISTPSLQSKSRKQADNSDSEDDLPLNLSVQKT